MRPFLRRSGSEPARISSLAREDRVRDRQTRDSETGAVDGEVVSQLCEMVGSSLNVCDKLQVLSIRPLFLCYTHVTNNMARECHLNVPRELVALVVTFTSDTVSLIGTPTIAKLSPLVIHLRKVLKTSTSASEVPDLDDTYVDCVLELLRMRVESRQCPSVGERDALQSVYREYLGGLRVSLSSLKSHREDSERKGAQLIAKRWLLLAFERALLKHLEDTCLAAIGLILDGIVPVIPTEKVAERIYWLKYVSDYYRYCAEQLDLDMPKYLELAQDSYHCCLEQVEMHFAPADDVYLNIYINYSVFVSDILKDKALALRIAKETFDKAVERPRDEMSTRAMDLLLPMLRDNVTLWQEELAAEKKLKETSATGSSLK